MSGGLIGTNFSKALIKIHIFSLKKYITKCSTVNRHALVNWVVIIGLGSGGLMAIEMVWPNSNELLDKTHYFSEIFSREIHWKMSRPHCVNFLGSDHRQCGVYSWDFFSKIVQRNQRCLTSWMYFNPLRAKFFRVNINIYLYFVSFLHTNKTQVVEIPPRVRQGPAYSS